MHTGQLLADRFLLERLAGRGGMGEVFRALDRDTGHPVAIKVLHGQQGGEDLHWGDGSMVRLLDRALRDCIYQPLFVLAMARPEVHQVFLQLWAERQWQVAMVESRLAALTDESRRVLRAASSSLGSPADELLHLEATGKHEAAKDTFASAREWLFVTADKIGDPDSRKSFLENVPENRRTLALVRQWLGEDA